MIIGAGGFGREVMSIAMDITRKNKPNWRLHGFLDDNMDALNGLYTMGYDVIDTISGHIVSDENIYVCAIADSLARERICKDFISKGAKFATLIHPSCKIGYTANFGNGLIMAQYSTISENVTVNDFVIINAYTGIGHDAVIGEYCTLSAHCDVTGHVTLGKRVFLGSSAVISPGVTICDNARVGAGSVVLRKVKPDTTVFGNPAKRIY